MPTSNSIKLRTVCMQASGPAPRSRDDAQGVAYLSREDSSAAERGLWTLLDSPADSYGSAAMASPPMESSSQHHASPELEASGDVAWGEHSSRTIDRQEPSFAASGPPGAVQQHATALASPTEDSGWLQHSAEQDRERISAAAEGHSPAAFDDGKESAAGTTALASAEESLRPQHAEAQAWEHSSSRHEAHNPLFDSGDDANDRTPKGALKHGSASIEGREALCDTAANDECAPEKLVMSHSQASDGHRDQDDAQRIISELRHELQASRMEVRTPSVPYAAAFSKGLVQRSYRTTLAGHHTADRRALLLDNAAHLSRPAVLLTRVKVLQLTLQSLTMH